MRSYLLDELPREKPGIYTICGGRQVGKTTLMKQWMAELLQSGVAPGRIAYLTGELIDDHHSLIRLLDEPLNEMSGAGVQYILLDEVTYIRDWDRGVKYLADAGMLENCLLFLSWVGFGNYSGSADAISGILADQGDSRDTC